MSLTMKYKKIAIFSLVVIFTWAIFLFVTVLAALSSSAIPLTKHQSKLISMLYPQSWGFFSKNPRDETLNIYDVNGEKQIPQWPNNTLSNIFGLNRHGRSQGIELGIILDQLPTIENWETTSIEQGIDIKHLLKLVEAENYTPNPTLCGQMIITSEEITPWAWSKNIKEKTQINKFIGVDVKCSSKN